MKRSKRIALAGISLAALWACAAGPDGPLASRGLPVERRHDFILDKGSDFSREIRNAFLEGCPEKGMPREWVSLLYGRPDRTTDIAWEYRDRKEGLIAGLVFKEDRVESIYGNPPGCRSP